MQERGKSFKSDSIRTGLAMTKSETPTPPIDPDDLGRARDNRIIQPFVDAQQFNNYVGLPRTPQRTISELKDAAGF